MRDFYLQKKTGGETGWYDQKNGTDGKECGSNPLQHFTGWIFSAANFCRV